jgi:hypothetical protein
MGGPLLSPSSSVVSGLTPSRSLPVPGPLRELFAEEGLRRGSVVSVAPGAGATALVLALVAAPLLAGSWAGIVGTRALGLEAAVELGVRLDRLALVPDPGADWPTVTAALLDAVDLVVVAPTRRCRPAEERQLVARARQREAVLILASLDRSAGPVWNERADLELTTEVVRWEGLGSGYGTLRRRQLVVHSAGRRGADRFREARVWLPGPDGQLLGGVAVERRGEPRLSVSATPIRVARAG